ncbi:MAG TPA: nucleotidyltransferase domain-containing protein [Micromonosporaceae bacterium]|nr:nucleotidyltransferase domain-containing protein [Micromonosporaceae bacterium]
MPEENGANPRWLIAEQIAEAAQKHFPADILAIGVHGSLAHGDDTDSSDVDLVVVTFEPGLGPRPGTRRVDGILVDLDVIDADEYLRHARTLSTSWPLAADQYMTTKPIYDPQAWLEKLRDVHLGRLADARNPEFTTLAREAWCQGAAAHARATRRAACHETEPALLLLAEARVAAAAVIGLLTRTYFRNSADAVTRTGLAAAGITELGAVLRAQAEELTARGRPVDTTVDELFDG